MNYNGYCSPEVDNLIDQQSSEADQEKRKQLVWEIERKLAEDGARPIIFYDRRATCWNPQVKGLTLMVNSLWRDGMNTHRLAAIRRRYGGLFGWMLGRRPRNPSRPPPSDFE